LHKPTGSHLDRLIGEKLTDMFLDDYFGPVGGRIGDYSVPSKELRPGFFPVSFIGAHLQEHNGGLLVTWPVKADK
jgi:hypothetical protein